MANKTNADLIEEIRGKLDKRTLLEGLAEETGELTAASMKVSRAFKYNNNWTPVGQGTAFQNLEEELTDVILIADVLGISVNFEMYDKKLERWAGRLRDNTTD